MGKQFMEENQQNQMLLDSMLKESLNQFVTNCLQDVSSAQFFNYLEGIAHVLKQMDDRNYINNLTNLVEQQINNISDAGNKQKLTHLLNALKQSTSDSLGDAGSLDHMEMDDVEESFQESSEEEISEDDFEGNSRGKRQKTQWDRVRTLGKNVKHKDTGDEVKFVSSCSD